MPQGINTPIVDALTRGDKTPGVDTEGNGATGEDGWGRGGDGNPPTTRASVYSGADGGKNGMARGPRTEAPPRPSSTAADKDSTGPLPWKSDGADGSRPKNGTHPRREYGLLAPEEPEEPEGPEDLEGPEELEEPEEPEEPEETEPEESEPEEPEPEPEELEPEKPELEEPEPEEPEEPELERERERE